MVQCCYSLQTAHSLSPYLELSCQVQTKQCLVAWHPFKTSMGCLEQITGDIHIYVELTLVLYQVFWTIFSIIIIIRDGETLRVYVARLLELIS